MVEVVFVCSREALAAAGVEFTAGSFVDGIVVVKLLAAELRLKLTPAVILWPTRGWGPLVGVVELVSLLLGVVML